MSQLEEYIKEVIIDNLPTMIARPLNLNISIYNLDGDEKFQLCYAQPLSEQYRSVFFTKNELEQLLTAKTIKE